MSIALPRLYKATAAVVRAANHLLTSTLRRSDLSECHSPCSPHGAAMLFSANTSTLRKRATRSGGGGGGGDGGMVVVVVVQRRAILPPS